MLVYSRTVGRSQQGSLEIHGYRLHDSGNHETLSLAGKAWSMALRDDGSPAATVKLWGLEKFDGAAVDPNTDRATCTVSGT